MNKQREPEALRELHRIREQIHKEAVAVGIERYWAEANRQGREFARRHGLKYVQAKPGVEAIREKRSKQYKTR